MLDLLVRSSGRLNAKGQTRKHIRLKFVVSVATNGPPNMAKRRGCGPIVMTIIVKNPTMRKARKRNERTIIGKRKNRKNEIIEMSEIKKIREKIKKKREKIQNLEEDNEKDNTDWEDRYNDMIQAMTSQINRLEGKVAALIDVIRIMTER